MKKIKNVEVVSDYIKELEDFYLKRITCDKTKDFDKEIKIK